MTNKLPNSSGDEPKVNLELQQFAADLSRLRPREDRLDRERLAFLAGQASMTDAPLRSEKAIGPRLESRAWPAAFAAMSAVAASLLFLLIVRPETPHDSSIAIGDRNPINQNVAGEPRSGRRDVLTTQDARSGDLEARLARIEVEKKEPGAPASFDDRRSPVFTPAAWRQAVLESDSPTELPRKSTNLQSNQGITT